MSEERTNCPESPNEVAQGPEEQFKPIPGAKPIDAPIEPAPQVIRRQTQGLPKASFPNGYRPGQPVPTTIDNVKFMMERYGVLVRYDVIKKRTHIDIPGFIGTVDNRDNATMAHILSLGSLNGLSASAIPAFVEAIADMNACNPVADWIHSKPWDGEDRLATFFATVETEAGYPITLKETLLRKWLLSCVAAALVPAGFHCRGVLTLQGPQSIGKTSWVRSLVPDLALCSEWVKLDHHLDPSDKDSRIGAITHWIVEIGELDSSFKKDVARLKGFITALFDKVRRPYARSDSEYPRRTVFVATVNDQKFLVDSTGNSRWWTIAVTKLDYNHGIDMQQLFAQLAAELADGGQWWLTPSEEAELANVNAPHQSVSAIEETILAHVDQRLMGRGDNPRVGAAELLQLLGYDKPSNGQAKEAAVVLRDLLGPAKRVRGRDVWRFPGTIEQLDRGVRRMARPPEPDIEPLCLPALAVKREP